MIVWMASGMARIISVNPTDSTRTLTATNAAELAETVRGGAQLPDALFSSARCCSHHLRDELLRRAGDPAHEA
jgi:ABC-type uncharacterized transport system permease subunit